MERRKCKSKNDGGVTQEMYGGVVERYRRVGRDGLSRWWLDGVVFLRNRSLGMVVVMSGASDAFDFSLKRRKVVMYDPLM